MSTPAFIHPPGNLTSLSPGSAPPERIDAIVEIQQGGSNKYEYDPSCGLFRLDRVLYSAVHYPMAYGFIPGTLADDGDPLDILVMTRTPTFTGCIIEASPIGVFRMEDEKGEDEKIISIPVVDPRYTEVKSLEDMRPHYLREIEHFFSIYKDLEGKPVNIRGWEGRQGAYDTIMESIERFQVQKKAEAGA